MTHSKFLQAMQAADGSPEPVEGRVLAYLTEGRVTLQVETGRPFHLNTDEALELAGHIRALATGPELSASAAECRHCTVPVGDGSRVCAFCNSYVPPETTAQRLDVAVNRIDLIRADLNKELQGLPGNAPLFAVTDLVVALNHLKRGAVALDRATDALEADTAAVTL